MEATLPGVCLSKLDPTETKPQALMSQSTAQHRVHAQVWDERERNIRAFENDGDEALAKRAGRMGLCCVAPVLRLEKGRVPVVSPGRCRDRLCPLCSRVRGRVARERIKGLVLKADSVRLITLTMPADDADLSDRMTRLFDAFSRLRRLAGWKKAVRGGLFVCEITRGREGKHWHVHLHVLADGSYYDCKALTADWHVAMGCVAGTDIRAVHSRIQAANYVTKYVAKGADTSEWSESVICDFARGVHRRRLYGTFGTWHRADVTRDDDDEQEKAPKHGVSMATICDAVRSGTLDPDVYVPLLGRLGFVAQRMLAPFVYTPPALDVQPTAAEYEQLTMFGLELANVHRDDEPPPLIEPPPDRVTGRLWTEHAL